MNKCIYKYRLYFVSIQKYMSITVEMLFILSACNKVINQVRKLICTVTRVTEQIIILKW